MKKRQSQKDHRTAELAKIHVAKKQLGLDESTYRLMLREIGGADSSADLDAEGRRAVLDHLTARGFKAKTKGRPGNIGHKPGARGDRNSRAAQLQKIEALLTIGRRPWAYADALAARICRTPEGEPIQRIAFVPDDQLYKVIAALRYQAKREGWDLSGEKGPWAK